MELERIKNFGKAGLILKTILIRKAGNRIMNRTLMRDVIRRLTGSMAIALLALGVFGSQSALAGITDTKHNLGSTVGNPGVNKTTGTAEICVFCHTPHGADTSASVPLWNRDISTPPTYTTYNTLGTSSLDGAMAPVGSVSLACLSCHDGTQAMNVVINSPGSGTSGTVGAITDWTGANQLSGQITGAYSKIGQDLTNDHPIGIQYGGGPTGATIAATGVYSTFKDPDFNDAQSAPLNGTQVWWVDTTVGTAASREKTDMQLYTRGKTGDAWSSGTSNIVATLPQPFVECASCHDPHSSANGTFLRISNDASAVCLACHIK